MVTGSLAATVISDARHRFFDIGDMPRGMLPEPILRSWQRCAAMGLDGTTLRPSAEGMSSRELAEVSERHELLRRYCRSEMETLMADANATDSIIILTDQHGVVLDTIGSADFADQAARVALRPGMIWSETASGTNAIGTAIVERQAVAVRGGEHFFAPHGILNCSAVPIFGPKGEILGVLDISGHSSRDHAHALGLAQLAVDHIEQRSFERGFEHCQTVRFHRDPLLLGTAREGVLVFDDNRLVAANRHGLALIGSSWQAIDTAHYEDLFATDLGAAADQGHLRLPGGGVLPCRLPEIAPRHRAKPQRPHPSPAPRPAPTPSPIFDAGTKAALARAVRLLDAEVPILVQGETGTGKEIFARTAHAKSARRDRPFIAVNCAALPESLIEAELFGYVPGAFTGAKREGSKGWLREADGGTLFLDEIGDMPVSLQSRLLRTLQEREVVPVGGRQAIPVDFTVMCATHRPLADLMNTGAFRADLYFRIAQYTVELPPVRATADRRTLITALWLQMGTPATLAPECLDLMACYAWPGNFRQLAGTLRALMVLAEPGRPIGVEALPEPIRAAASDINLGTFTGEEPPGDLAGLTHEAIRKALADHHGNVSKAARQLGISRSTLYRRLS